MFAALFALIAFPAIADTQPHNPTPTAAKEFNAGIMFARSKNYAEAAEKFQQACQADPEWAKAHCMWGYMMLHQGKMEQAQAELEKSYAMQPDAPDTLVYLGILRQMKGEIEPAQKILEKYLTLYPHGDEAPRVKAMLANVTADLKQRQTVSSSKRQDNYYEEAAAQGFKRWEEMDWRPAMGHRASCKLCQRGRRAS